MFGDLKLGPTPPLLASVALANEEIGPEVLLATFLLTVVIGVIVIVLGLDPTFLLDSAGICPALLLASSKFAPEVLLST